MTDSSANPRGYGERPAHEDDPLMELSRIMDFDAPVSEAANWNARPREPDFDPALDLERELLGDFDEPSYAGRRAAPEPRREQPHEADLAAALEDELDLHLDPAPRRGEAPEPDMFEFVEPDRAEPVPQFDFADYSQARDSGDARRADPYGGRHAEPAMEAYDPADHEPAHEALSLEDELENILFTDRPAYAPQPAAYAPEPEAPAQENLRLKAFDFGEPEAPVSRIPSRTPEPDLSETESPIRNYYSRSNFLQGVAAASPVAAAASAAAAAPQHQYEHQHRAEEEDFSFDDDFGFEPEQAHAPAAEATDDFSGLDDMHIHLAEEDFGFEESGDAAAAPAHQAHQEDDPFADFDLGDDLHEEVPAAAPAYAHATRSDEDYRAGFVSAAPAAVPAPDVETLSVAEDKVEQTHSLDLPEVSYGEEEQAAGLSDLEAEFAEVFNTVGVEEPRPDAQSEADKAFEDIFRESASSYLPAAGAAAFGAAAAQASTGSRDDYYNHWAAQGAQPMEGGYDAPPPEDELAGAAEAYRNNPVRGRRGLVLASLAGAVVLLGGVGYHFLHGAGSGEPVVIHADSQPIKVQPENPGGVTVPNQDKAVYDRVAGTLPDDPSQKALISSGQEPVDISGADDSEPNADQANQPDAGNQANAAQPNAAAPAGNEVAPGLQPREVETMVVRSDGTIVQPAMSEPASQEPAPAPAAPQAATPAPQAAPSGGDEIAALAAGGSAPDTAPAAPAAQEQAAAPVAEKPRLPVHAPLVPSRPASQPVNIVGNVPQRTQAAAAAPQVASAAGAGGYFIQIASQPSADLAQKSYANMAQKYANVIGGRGVDIKRADIPGKGTFYRVRVQAGSKDDAAALCTKLRAAGGTCLISR